MSDQNKQEQHIVAYKGYLSQGDIFRIDLVAPMADPERTIFRTEDGRHASAVKVDGSDGKIFSYDELLEVIEALPPAERLLPFQRTTDGKFEKVLVYADVLEYFIILSQTCDISGLDKQANPTCTIAPVATLAQHFQGRTSFSWRPLSANQNESQTVSIPDYISERFDPTFRDMVSNDLEFPAYLRRSLGEWRKKAKKKPQENSFLSKIKGSLNTILGNEPLYMYYVLPSIQHEVPESYVDFCRIYTLSTSIVEGMKNKRLATLGPQFREEFAQRFANYYGRIATPYPMRGTL